MDFAQQIRERLVLSDVIGRYLKLSKKGNEYQGLCPFHNEKTPSFTVNNQKGLYYCFGCGEGGTAFDFVMKKENMTFMEVLEKFATSMGMTIPSQSLQLKKDPTLYDVMETAALWFQKQFHDSKIALAYCEKRKLSHESISFFKMGYAPNSGLTSHLESKGFNRELQKKVGLLAQKEENNDLYERFRNRLMFPIMDSNNRVIAFGGRTLDDNHAGAKYMNSPETPLFHKGNTLFSLNNAVVSHKSTQTPYWVVEGYMDVIMLHQYGIKTAVAPLGTALTEDHIIKLWSNTPSPILCFDGDAAGIKAAERALLRILPILPNTGKTVQFVTLPHGDDPDSFILKNGPKAFISQPTINLVDFFWAYLADEQLYDTPEHKGALKSRILDHINMIHNADMKSLYRHEFMERYKNLCFSKNNNTLVRLKKPQKVYKKEDAHKILLAIVLKYPTLINNIIESLAYLNFDDPELEQLRLYIIDKTDEFINEDWESIENFANIKHNVFSIPLVSLIFSSKSEWFEHDYKILWDEVYASLFRKSFIKSTRKPIVEEI